MFAFLEINGDLPGGVGLRFLIPKSVIISPSWPGA